MILQSLIATLGYIFVIGMLGLSAHAITFLPPLLAFPFAASVLTLFLYLFSFAALSPLVTLAASCAATIALFFVWKKYFTFRLQVSPIPKSYVIFFVLVSLLLTIPRLTFLTNFTQELRFPYIGDETKHIAVLTSITASRSFPPRFPYDPTIPFSYYYFYYLIPAAVLQPFPHAISGYIWFAHVLATQIMTYAVCTALICTLSQKPWIRTLGIGMAFFGTSLKIIPKLFHWWGVTEPHIEHWWQIPSDAIFGTPALIGWQITHPMTLAIWTPQHQWAGALAALIAMFLIQKKHTAGTYLAVGLLLTVLIGTSAFVAATLFVVLAIYAVVSVKKIKAMVWWIGTLSVPFLFTFPLLRVMGANQAGISFSPYLPYLPRLPGFIGVPLFYSIETGIVLPLLVILLVRNGQKLLSDRVLLFLALATIVPLVLPRLVVSQFMNDVGMRIPIIYTVFMPAVLVFLLDQTHFSHLSHNIVKRALVICIIAGAAAGALELYFQSSKIETYPESLSSIYKVTARFTNPDDIMLVNDAYMADRMPLFAGRMTIKPTMPFSMDVYVPKRDDKGEKYPQAICPIYTALHQKLPSARVVYVELGNVTPLQCSDVSAQKIRAPILFSSPAVTLYRL